MWSVNFYLTGKNNENQLFQVPSITESETYEYVEKDNRSHAVLFIYLFHTDFSTGRSVPDSVI